MQRVTDAGYWLDPYLISNLDSVIHNLNNDFDFVWLVSGDGMVRVGKSVIAQQIGYYVAYHMKTDFTLNNLVFSGDELIKRGHELPKNSVIIYDEARGDLDSKKTMQELTQKILDFFAECGMYNHFFILVMPDFFEYPKSIAVKRSEVLINVLRGSKVVKSKSGGEVVEFTRGYFEFYNRKEKKKLYILGKKNYDSYDVGKRNFYGSFTNQWVLPFEEYTRLKLNYIRRARDKKARDAAKGNHWDIIVKNLHMNPLTSHLKPGEMARLLGISDQYLYQIRKRLGFTGKRTKYSIK